MTISPEKSARMLTELVEGKPGVDWKSGEVYSKGKPMSVAFKDDGTVHVNCGSAVNSLLITYFNFTKLVVFVIKA
ncbi:hypothetical protein [Gracilibacillus boraciitolerans]|uniref:hypothetical protein n=1 Tax=Gracilibacillus boraciitolerans TaxID=307521 RepID=UPI001F384A6C|nr:hypothetical protein [Gracilibacillus boraciitolerans]